MAAYTLMTIHKKEQYPYIKNYYDFNKNDTKLFICTITEM